MKAQSISEWAEEMRPYAIRARAVERWGLESWDDMGAGVVMQYFPAVGQVYDISFADGSGEAVMRVVREHVYPEHGLYYHVELDGGGGMGIPASEWTRLAGDNSARLRKGE